jgi:hypothetical protein
MIVSGWPVVDLTVEREEGRVGVEVVTTSGRIREVEFRVLAHAVEVWHDQRCDAVLEREALRAWLAEPLASLTVEQLTLTLDLMVDVRGRVALTLPDVNAWTLAPVELAALIERV